MAKTKKIKEICGNCLLYNSNKKECKIAIIIQGEELHLPVEPQDNCHMDELGIPVQQVRWWVEDGEGKKTEGNGVVKIEYPEGFFGNQQ